MKCPLVALLWSFVLPAMVVVCVATTVVAQTTTKRSFRVGPVKQFRTGVDAWPLTANPSNRAEQRVNATLARQNRELIKSLKDCDKNYLKWLKIVDHVADGKTEIAKDWSRKVKVTMDGPRFLSLVATDKVFCGGAHPDSDTSAMVFDMTTGLQVDWLKMFKNSAGASEYSDTISDGRNINALVLPALQKINITFADTNCKDAFRDPQPFLIWPDAKQGKLVALPFDLPHVVQACANEIGLTMEQSRKLGFDENLLRTIEQAHGQSAENHKL